MPVDGRGLGELVLEVNDDAIPHPRVQQRAGELVIVVEGLGLAAGEDSDGVGLGDQVDLDDRGIGVEVF